MNTVIFDLDGTLLPIDHEAFIKEYFRELVKKIAPLGFDPQKLVESIKAGTQSMVENDGTMTNEERFWITFETYHGKDSGEVVDDFLNFYKYDFPQFEKFAQPDPLVKQITDELKNKGYDLLLATNPLFPMVATESRVRWAGIDPDIFSYITTYESASFSKPNIQYYKEMLEKSGKEAKACLMVGNGLDDDMIIAELGTDTFLVSDALTEELRSHKYVKRAGNREELLKYVQTLPAL